MTIERNGISGLIVRSAVIALAVLMFGCAPRAAAQAAAPTPIAAAP